ncbi:uncharacterized protein METZ01_LOCUS478398, partial [marine metagenome]
MMLFNFLINVQKFICIEQSQTQVSETTCPHIDLMRLKVWLVILILKKFLHKGKCLAG